MAYADLIAIFIVQKDDVKVEELLKKCINICEEGLLFGDVDVSSVYASLAELYSRQARYKEAEELYIKSLKENEFEVRMGRGNLNVIDIYWELAIAYIGLDQYPKALNYLAKIYIYWVFQLEKGQKNALEVYEQMKKIYFDWFPDGNFDRWFEERMQILE